MPTVKKTSKTTKSRGLGKGIASLIPEDDNNDEKVVVKEFQQKLNLRFHRLNLIRISLEKHLTKMHLLSYQNQ